MLAATGLVAVLLGAGCGLRAEAPRDLEMHDLGPYRVGVATSPDPPVTGENVLTLVVKDAAGRPVADAAVQVVVWMPAMGAMPYMESRGRVRAAGSGVYRAQYALAMAGDWEVGIRILPREGEPGAGGWRLSTNRKGVTFAGGPLRPATEEAAAAESTGGASDHTGHAPSGGTGTAAAGGEPPDAVSIDAARRQSLGIRVEPVGERDLVVEVRAAGRIAYDETRRADVSARFSGWVRAIHADFTGQPVRGGEVLFEIYSPDLWSAQQEFLQAVEAAREDSARGGPGTGADLADAARKRLTLWGLSAADIDRIARAGRPLETLPVRSPISGVITQKNIVLGSPVSVGQVLYAIAPTDPVWVLANVYEQDLPLVRVGTPVRLAPAGVAGRERDGRVAFIAPDLASDTRTGTVRIEVANPDGELKPGMYVDARMEVPLGRRLAIPESAVLPTGERRIVFVDLGDGRLAPRDVALGARAGDWYEVRGGLERGDRIVTSGNFLVAAESRLRSATGKW
jgi:Cu(I)/Ag(I) efflux system membrane fusion protein